MADLAKKFGIGTYTKKDGRVISHADLPPEVQKEIGIIGAQRDLAKSGGDTTSEYVTSRQGRINELYDPDTRDDAMRRITGERIVRELNDRLSRRR